MASLVSRRWRLAGFVLALAASGIAAAIALGFFGRWAPPFDSFSHFRAHFAVPAVAVALMLCLLRRWGFAALAGLAAAAAVATTVPALVSTPPDGGGTGPRYTLLQMNLLYDAPDRGAALQRIAEAQPDIVTLQEMTPEWRRLTSFLEAYPFQLHCDNADGFSGDAAILSRRAFVEGSAHCDRRNSLASARIDFNGVLLTVVSHHQLWPWPRGQWRRLDDLRETLSALSGPTIIAGDFNAVPWSALIGDYAALTGTRAITGIGPTWFPSFISEEWGRRIGLPIDNVLVSPEVAVLAIERMSATTSDHLPVRIGFTLTPDEPAGALIAGPASAGPGS